MQLEKNMCNAVVKKKKNKIARFTSKMNSSHCTSKYEEKNYLSAVRVFTMALSPIDCYIYN